jgi:N-acetylneuraminate synthase
MSSIWYNNKSRRVDLQLPESIYIIAEAGINHNGDISIAKELIDMAVDAGCDAIKFQKRTIDIVYSQEVLASHRESPWGTTQRDQKIGLEFGIEEYSEIDAYCRENKIAWTASAWDIPSLEFIENFEPPFHKVASAMLTNIPFLKQVAKFRRPTIVSTGMADLNMIDQAVQIFTDADVDIALLHTVSTYPTRDENLNLQTMLTLKERYQLPIGYSGHESHVSPSVVAVALGAAIVERHITLDRTMYGSDQSASLEGNGLKQLVNIVRAIPSMLGSGEKIWVEGEREVASKLRYWEQ